MNQQQREAHDELIDIHNQLLVLANQAERIQAEAFPEESSWCNAYRVFDFGRSCNPYDMTFEKLIENLTRRDEEDMMEGQS